MVVGTVGSGRGCCSARGRRRRSTRGGTGIARRPPARGAHVGVEPLGPRSRVHRRAELLQAHAGVGEPDGLRRPALARVGVLLEVRAQDLARRAAASEGDRGGARGALGRGEAGLAVAVDEALDGDLAREEDGPGEEGSSGGRGRGGGVCSSSTPSTSSASPCCCCCCRPHPSSSTSPSPTERGGRSLRSSNSSSCCCSADGGPPAKLDPLPSQRPRPQYLPQRRRPAPGPGPRVPRPCRAEHQSLEQSYGVSSLRSGPSSRRGGVRRPGRRARDRDAPAGADRRAACSHHRPGGRRGERRGPQRRRAEAPSAGNFRRGPSRSVPPPLDGQRPEGRRGGGAPAVLRCRPRRVADQVVARQHPGGRRGPGEALRADQQVRLVRALVRVLVPVRRGGGAAVGVGGGAVGSGAAAASAASAAASPSAAEAAAEAAAAPSPDAAPALAAAAAASTSPDSSSGDIGGEGDDAGAGAGPPAADRRARRRARLPRRRRGRDPRGRGAAAAEAAAAEAAL